MPELALTRPDPTLTMDVLRARMEAAKRYVDSGMLPAGIKTPQQALLIMQKGAEIGVPSTYALASIHVIEGKPSCSAELLMALVRRAYGQAAIRVKTATNEECVVEYREAGWDGVSQLSFSIADAKVAGLAEKAMWKKYPRAMLRSRAVSECVRTAFPECIAGLYTPEELGADVRVGADGSLELAGPTSSPVRPKLAIVDDDEPRLPTDADRAGWQRLFFHIVKGFSLEDRDTRHRYVYQWTASNGWPAELQTELLSEAFARMTLAEGERFLDDVRAVVDGEKAELLRQAAERGDKDMEPF